MSGYRTSPLAPQAPGTAEIVTQHDGHTMGGRVPAFVGLAQKTGGVFFEKTTPVTVMEAFRQTGLDFRVSLQPLTTTVVTDDGVTTHDLPRHRATLGTWADGHTTPFGPVGTRYTPIQNDTVAGLGQLVVDGGEGSLIAVGAFGEPVGARVYMAFDLGDFLVGGSDRHNLALTLITTHDGSGGLTAQARPVRVQCTNEVSFGRGSRFTIRHTESADGRAQEIRQALGMTWKYVDAYQDQSERLLGQSMSEHDFLAWEHELFGVPNFEDSSQRQRTMIGNRDELLLDVWNGPNAEFGRGTRFAAAQSVYEYLDHMSIIRGADPETSRWERILAGQTEQAKGTAWASLLAA